MDILRLRKYDFDNRAFILLIIVCFYFSPTIQANSSDIENEIDNQSLIQSISYSYELVSDNNKLNCIGTLNLSLNLPSDISYLIMERTNRFSKFDDPENVRFTIKSTWPGTTTYITKSDIYWDTYFRIIFYRIDESYIVSPTYSINDYINSSDLNLLLSQGAASIENSDVDAENVCINIQNKNLEINSNVPIYLNIFDFYGRCLNNKDMVTTETIPLNNVTSPFIIVRYKTSKNTITKKFILQ